MGVLETDVRFAVSPTLPADATIASIDCGSFHTWGERQYFDFYSADLAIPASELRAFCKALDSSQLAQYIIVEGIKWSHSFEKRAIPVDATMLRNLAWEARNQEASLAMIGQTQNRQREISLETMKRWAGGKWPFDWDRSPVD